MSRGEWRLEENVQRDIEKAQEQIDLYGGHVLKAPNRFELRTGVIVAARFADKLRRIAFAVFSHTVPRDEVLRAVADLNRGIYERLTAMGVGKLDLVRITVEAAVEGGRLAFGEPKIELFIPAQEAQRRVEECQRKMEDMRKRLEEILKEL